ncbi:DoxX family protein [Streptomyces uncialis]|uniref:Membrane protein n=1 Tax=Streptomyces uncialis TaxID=1048205 RepID=A0A1Q4V9Q3_9ACTN|nr:DoxX family protein [Streptomyces uncialis]OKH94588.1 membrane protein [Streptomyces uncialis]
MEIGLLVLRLLLGGLLFGHAAQKLFGWFRGHGPDGTGTVFETWGFRPGKPLVVLAALCELIAAASMVTGLLIPLGAAIALGTMLVAGSVNVSKGLWAQSGGYELPLVYGGLAVGLGFTGPGEWSLDHAFGLTELSGAGWGGAAVALGLLTGLVAVARAARERRRRTA